MEGREKNFMGENNFAASTFTLLLCMWKEKNIGQIYKLKSIK